MRLGRPLASPAELGAWQVHKSRPQGNATLNTSMMTKHIVSEVKSNHHTRITEWQVGR
jgi:hypothetical protein